MAAYPPGPSRMVDLPAYGANSAPTDRFWIASAATGFALGSAADKYITPNDFLAEITRNITDISVQFGNGAAATVSAAAKGKIIYNNTAGSFQVSENGAAYQNLLKGSGTATRVAFWSVTSDELSSDAALYWDNTNKRLSVGVGTSPGAPIDVLAESVSAIAQQWRPNTGTMRAAIKLDGGPETFFGTTTPHNFHLITNSLQRLSIEDTSGNVGINKASLIGAQLQVVANATTTKPLVLNSAPSTSVNLAEFYNDASVRFTFSNAGNLLLGKAGASGATGSLTFAVNGQANTQTLQGGDTPAATNTFKWPSADPTVGQALTASAPAGGIVTLSWSTIVTAPANPNQSVQFNNSGAFGGDSAFIWDNTNKRLSVGVGTSPGAPIDVLAESVSAIAQQWRPNTGTMRAVIKLDGGPETFFGTSTAHNFHLITTGIQRLSIEATSGNVGINKASLIGAQLQVVANATTTIPLLLNSAPSTSVNLAEFYNDASVRFTFSNAGNLLLGKAGASGATGSLTFAVNGQANTQTLQGGDTPAATNTFKWPSADPTASQVLTASAPSGGIVTLSWTTVSAGATINPTDNVMPVRTSSTTFGDSNLSLVSGVTALTSSNAAAFGVGPNGNTNPALRVVCNVASAATGISITGNAAGSGVTLTTLSSGTNENIAISPKGTGKISFVLSGGSAASAQINNSDGSNASFECLSGGSIVSRLNGFWGLTLTSDREVRWATAVGLATSDTNLSRFAANTVRVGIADSGSGAGKLLIAPTTASMTGNLTVLPDNAATNSIVTVARLGVNSTGTAADGFGAALSWSAETSTTNDTETGRENVFWSTATHASRTSAFSWSLVNNATLAEIMRLTTPSATVGSPFVLNIHDGTNPNVWTSGSFAAKLYLISPTLPAVGVAAHFSATGADAPQWQMLRGRGTNASPTAIQSGDSIGNLEWWGQTSTSTNNVVAGARIRVSTTENWSAGNNGCQMIFYTSNNASTITDRMYIKETGTVRIGATAGSYNTTTLLQIGGYSSWNTDVVAAIYTGANGTKGLEIIGTASATASPLRIFRDSLTPDLLNLAASGVLSLRAGLNTGTTTAKVGGTIREDFTPVSNTSTTETDLMTFSLPANTLGTDNDYLEVEAFGEFSSAVSNKTVKLYFGSTVIFSTGALAFGASAWRLKATVVRGGATSQLTIAVFSGNTTLLSTTAQVASPSATLSGAVTVKCTGQDSVGSGGVTQEGFIIKWFPASN